MKNVERDKNARNNKSKDRPDFKLSELHAGIDGLLSFTLATEDGYISLHFPTPESQQSQVYGKGRQKKGNRIGKEPCNHLRIARGGWTDGQTVGRTAEVVRGIPVTCAKLTRLISV